MPEETPESSGFKVVDRRPFTEEGARRPDAQVSEERKESAPPRSAETGRASAPNKAPAQDDRLDERFATLVELLANGALTNLGLLDGGAGQPLSINLAGARAMIDLLGTLEDKTKGNLSNAEQKFLAEVLFELHTRFVEVQRQAAPKRR